LIKEVHEVKDLIALQFDPVNDEMMRELTNVKDKGNFGCEQGCMEEDTHPVKC